MAGLIWGLLGPETLDSERRTRTLGVGASVRSFNDLAVPGLGGIWFGKQLFLATLGVAIAERVRAGGKHIQNIEIANAIEALACWLTLNSNGWKSDARLRGATKMQGKTNLSFAIVRKSGFYVTQPMRMATVQPLPALGLVEADGNRFNAFTCSQHGYDFIDALCADYNPCHYSKSVLDCLVNWVRGESVNLASNGKLCGALSPLDPMSKGSCEILMERLIQGGSHESQSDKGRRRAILGWMESLRSQPNQKLTWDNKPPHSDDAHWHDLHAGALFFTVRDVAIRLLDRLEAHIGNQEKPRLLLDDPIPDSIKPDIQNLRVHAQAFLKQRHKDELANAFCGECVDEKDGTLLASLVGRDERVLRHRDSTVLPGPAFRGTPTQASDADQTMSGEMETSITGAIGWPEGISHRVRNLFLLNADLHGELPKWFGETDTASSGDDQ